MLIIKLLKNAKDKFLFKLSLDVMAKKTVGSTFFFNNLLKIEFNMYKF